MEKLKDEIQKTINLYKSQKFIESELLCKKILEKNSKNSFLYNLLGLILIGQRKINEAIRYYEKGIKIKPDYAMIYNNLGAAHKSLRDNFKAEKYYKKAIKFDNKIVEAHNNLGNLYKDLNKHIEALSCYKKAIKINSNFYVAHYNLGILYKSIGKFKESKKYLKDSLKLYPQFYSAHRAYSQINKYKINDDHIREMKSLYNENSIDINGRIELAFGLGKAFDDIKDFENAFKFYKDGNNLCKKNIKFSLENENKEFSNIKKSFNKNFFERYKNIGNKLSTPIFILGMPRSGTTLIEQIVSSHPSVYGGDELNFLNELIKEHFYINGNLSITHINQRSDKYLSIIAQKYLEKIKEISKNSKRVTDKLPINFKWIGFIKVMLPNSKIIHCIRNSRDTCLSIYKNYFTNKELNYAYDLDELVAFYNLYNDLMKFWKRNFPKFIIEIKYENLIKDPKKEIKNLIKQCDLSWNENCMKFYNNKRAIKTASDTQARSKIYSSSINSWKNYEKLIDKSLEKLEY